MHVVLQLKTALLHNLRKPYRKVHGKLDFMMVRVLNVTTCFSSGSRQSCVWSCVMMTVKRSGACKIGVLPNLECFFFQR